MEKSRNPLVVLALAGVVAFAGWKLGSSLLDSEGEAKRSKHLTNRVWIDHLPTGARDMIMHFVVLDHDRGRFGAVGSSSQWRHFIEVFLWRLEGKRLEVFFPQDEMRVHAIVKTWRCKGEAPAPFELCLRIKDPESGDSFVLYSREDWVVDPNGLADSAAELLAQEPGLAGPLGALASQIPGQGLPANTDAEDTADWTRVPLSSKL